jgi:hypothetical protein
MVPGPGLKFFLTGFESEREQDRSFFLAETETGPEPKLFLTEIGTRTETKIF